MPRTPEEIYAEIAAWPLADRLRLAARIIEEAARLAQTPARPKPEDAGTRGRGDAETPDSRRPRVPVSPRPSEPPRRPVAPSPERPASPAPPPPGNLLVVDGSNFLGTVPGFDLASDSSREELITRLQDFAHQHPSIRLIAYFDGQKTSVRRAGGVEVRFTQRGRPADFFILEALRALPDEVRRRALLVTADRELADKARRMGTKVEAPTSFHRRLPTLKRTAASERGLSANEVAAWEEYFQKPPDRGGKPPRK